MKTALQTIEQEYKRVTGNNLTDWQHVTKTMVENAMEIYANQFKQELFYPDLNQLPDDGEKVIAYDEFFEEWQTCTYNKQFNKFKSAIENLTLHVSAWFKHPKSPEEHDIN